MNLLEAVSAYAENAHRGERFKYVDGVYFEHPKAVSERMHTVHEKALAFLHDVVEHHVKRYADEAKAKNEPFPKEREDRLIRRKLDQISRYLHALGFEDIPLLIEDLDVLTKRTYDTDYHAYIQRIADHASRTGRLAVVKVKLADLQDNKWKERNPPLSRQTSKDKERITRYHREEKFLFTIFPLDLFPQTYPRSLSEMRKKRRSAKRQPKRPDRRRGKAESKREHYKLGRYDHEE